MKFIAAPFWNGKEHHIFCSSYGVRKGKCSCSIMNILEGTRLDLTKTKTEVTRRLYVAECPVCFTRWEQTEHIRRREVFCLKCETWNVFNLFSFTGLDF